MKIDLLTIAEGAASWAEMETRIAGLPSEQDRGEAFEEFCKVFLILDPLFQFKEVYRHNEIPPSLRQQLGYPGNQDIGIDGLCVTLEDKLYAYQAKFRSDRSNIPTLRELSTFFTVSDRADWRITIANANNLPAAINDRTKQSRILSDKLDQLEPEFFDRLRAYLKEHCVKPPQIKVPHKTQLEAIDAALSYFKENDRGQLILPCGTGKTLAAMWIAEKLVGSSILIMFPSLSLLSQTLREWAANTSLQPFRYLCLCSDTTVDLGNDSPIEHLYDMDVPVTTDIREVSDFLLSNKSSTLLVFSTYQSSKVLSEATKRSGTVFDIAIFDEAHRTTGTNVGVWNMALHDENIPIRKRIFMTATPRIYSPHIRKKAQEEDILICSMDDSIIYGEPFYEMTFGKAIERGHITDYKVIVICVTDSEVREIIRRGGRVITDDDHEWDAKAFAKRVALVKGIKEYDLKKVFTFHNKVKSAKAFTDTSTPYGIHQVFKMLDSENASHSVSFPQETRGKTHSSLRLGKGGPSNGIKFLHVNGTMPAGVRSSLMREFKAAEIGIVSNARCLTEGVDVPAVDTVAFIDPKKSLIDIVQATGRALRKAEWKERGYIFIPVIIEENSDPDKLFESSDFVTVWQVLQAMVDQDQRLESIISNMKIMQSKGEQESQELENIGRELSNKVELFTLSRKIDKNRFIKTLHIKIIDVIGRKWDFWYGLTLIYKEKFGKANAPFRYKTEEGLALGAWQASQKRLFIFEQIDKTKIQKLLQIGFVFPQKSLDIESFDNFKVGFRETLRYGKKISAPNVPAYYMTSTGFALGVWQSFQRQLYQADKLPSDHFHALNGIGFKWKLGQSSDEAFTKSFRETVKYNKQFGSPNAPVKYITPEGFALGTWQATQRRLFHAGKLNTERFQALDSVGFRWEFIDRDKKAFEKGLQETLRYIEKYGNPNAIVKYKTTDGYPLGEWQAHQRRFYNKGKLSKDKIQKLEEIGFMWTRLSKDGEAFEKGFKETVEYKERYGTPNAPPKYKTQENYSLGQWQAHQRKAFNNSKLSDYKIKTLNTIGFKWKKTSIDEEAFGKGYQETLKYKEQFGSPNALVSYKSFEGYPLGQWQAHQRFNKEKLDKEKIRILEKIGFKWKLVSKEKAFFEVIFDKGNLPKDIDELKLTVRSFNCLQNANINTIADLVQKTELEMLKIRNFGRKSLNEIKEIITKMGLHFGMNTDTENLRANQVQIGSIERDES